MLAATTAGRSIEEIREPILSVARTHFRPEFLNRVDEVVLFRALGRDELRAITELLLEQTRERLRAQRIELRLEPAAVDWLAERGHQPGFGARPLGRTIGRELERRLSRMLIAGDLSGGQRVVGRVVGDHLELAVESA
jgi:ATP-dependent Clp protease ATP-binding subunit ClpC